MRVIEILGIEQSRNQGICSLNEFRTFMGLKRESASRGARCRVRVLMDTGSVWELQGVESKGRNLGAFHIP